MGIGVRSIATFHPPSSSLNLKSSLGARKGFNVNSTASRIPVTRKAIQSPKAQSTFSLRHRRPQNVDGEFFVGKNNLSFVYMLSCNKFDIFWLKAFADHTCIDCDTCRWMAPVIVQTFVFLLHLENITLFM